MNKRDGHFSFQDVFAKEAEPCSREEELIEYFDGVLAGNKKVEFEKHLTSCSTCAATLAGLEETAVAGELTTIDAAKADQIFQKQRARLTDHLEVKYGKPVKPIQYSAPFFQKFRIPNYAGAFMAGLILLLAYPAYKGFVLDQQIANLQNEIREERTRNNQTGQSDLNAMKQQYEKELQNLTNERNRLLEPSVAVSEIHPVRNERAGENGVIQIQFRSPDETRNVVFSVPSGFDIYAVEISLDGTSIWSNQVPAAPGESNGFALVSVNLPARYFEKGTYALKIKGNKQQQTEELGGFRLKIS